MHDAVVRIADEKTDKILYAVFNELTGSKDILLNTDDLYAITKNSNGEILSVDYNMSNAYGLLNKISTNIKENLNNIENHNISKYIDDKYITSSNKGLVMYVPLFLKSKNVFVNNLGPRVPIMVNINNTLLTNIKTTITNYGINNALLEIYVTTEVSKELISPYKEEIKTFKYDILIGAKVINGTVPSFIGSTLQSCSKILGIPIDF